MSAGANFFQSSVIAVNAVSGYGILAMPYALAQGGWFGLIALFIIAVICTYTALLLQQCMDSNEFVKTYSDIGLLAFGNRGSVFMTLLMNVELYFVVIGLLIIEGDNLDIMFPGVKVNVLGLNIKGRQCFILLSTLLVLPTTWLKDIGVLSYLSLTNFVVYLFLLVLILCIGAFQGVGFNHKGTVVNWGQMPLTLSIFMFSYGGHTIVPTIYASMKDKRLFFKVLIIGFIVSTIDYVLMAIIGYLMFGEETESIVTLNLPKALVLSKVAIWTIIAIPLVKYALAIMPVVNSLEDKLQVKRRFSSILLRTGLVISTAMIASGMPFFTIFISLTGSLLISMASIIMPCLCYVKIFKPALNWGTQLLVVICIIVFGVLVAVLGTYVSIKQVMNHN